jgi:hypothetical protein
VRRAWAHGGDVRAVARRRDAGLDGYREEAFASSVPSTGGRRRVSDWEENLLLLSDWEENLLLLVRHALGSPMLATDNVTAMTELAMIPTAARTTAVAQAACTECRLLMPTRTWRSMIRRRWTLPLNVVADCGLTAARPRQAAR